MFPKLEWLFRKKATSQKISIDEAIRENKVQITHRDIRDYRILLGILRGFFQAGQKVLDLGSSANQELARQLEPHNIEVISIDPSIAYQNEEDKQKRNYLYPNPHKGLVAALAKQLPFPDNLFDRIVALNSIPFYSENLETFFLELNETIRVCKINGIIKIGPTVFKFDKTATTEKVINYLDTLQRSGKIKYSQIPSAFADHGEGPIFTIEKLF